jgi:hypothetical protein
MSHVGPTVCIFQAVLNMYMNISYYIISNNLIDLGKGSVYLGCFSWTRLPFIRSDILPSKVSWTAGCLSLCNWCQAVKACANMSVLMFL